MSIYYPGCTLVIPDPNCSDCPDKELGRVRSMWLQNVSKVFVDYTNPTEWAAAIQARLVYAFPFTQGTFQMNETLTPGFGNVDEDLDSYECVLNLMEPNLTTTNRNFWNVLRKAHTYLVGWRTETKIYVSSVPAVIIPKFEVKDDIKSKVVWNLGFKFVQEDIPQLLDMPVSVFDQCIDPS